MNYFSLARRVPEVSAVDPKILTWLYSIINQTPVVRTTQRRFVAGVLGQGVTHGLALDLGTGPGDAALELTRQRPELRVIGVDLAAHMLARARQQASRTRPTGHEHWVQADGHWLPFPDGTFDLVISSFSMHHWDDPLRVLDEIARVLRPDGCYYLADVCREVTRFQRLFAYASIPAVSLPFGSYLGYGGYYESVRAGYTRAEARALLARSDLPPGEVQLDGTWFVPVLTIAGKGTTPI
jgi:ubiquinone/menaquinone biosynthesis C-methylase UbiE